MARVSENVNFSNAIIHVVVSDVERQTTARIEYRTRRRGGGNRAAAGVRRWWWGGGGENCLEVAAARFNIKRADTGRLNIHRGCGTWARKQPRVDRPATFGL